MEPFGPEPQRGAPRVPAIGEALVATPVIGDDNFASTVLLVVHHDADGALGVVLNRPGTVPVDAVLNGWEGRIAEPAVVFDGGPVSPDHALGLGLVVPGGPPLDDDNPVFTVLPGQDPRGLAIGLVDLSSEPEGVPTSVEVVRIFGGYAGWGPGQLESELAAGAWWSTPVGPHEVLTGEPELLWERVVARQPGTRRLFARFPGDPALN